MANHIRSHRLLKTANLFQLYNSITSSKKAQVISTGLLSTTYTTFRIILCAYLSASCTDAATSRSLALAEWDNYEYLAFVCIAYERHHLQFNEDG